ncbi:MAG TPA: 4Fe-4S binding protein [Pelolinea sp.]|nr:4Fe-4S binding protein [Pelolinea sp.]
MESEHPLTFAQEVMAIPEGEYLEKCFACSTCVSRCLVQQKIEPDYNPRRLLHLVIMGMQDAAYENPTTWLCSSCDLCYPACPQEIHISGVINAVRQLALEAGYLPIIQAARVNQKTCVGCGLCEQVCPYQAISLVKLNIPFRDKETSVAQVNPDKCMGCGLCESVCRSTSIELTQPTSSESVIDTIHKWIQQSRKEVEA